MTNWFRRGAKVEVGTSIGWALGTVLFRGTIWDDDIQGLDFHIIEFENQAVAREIGPWVFAERATVRPIQPDDPEDVNFRNCERVEYLNDGIWKCGVICEMVSNNVASVLTSGNSGASLTCGVYRVRTPRSWRRPR